MLIFFFCRGLNLRESLWNVASRRSTLFSVRGTDTCACKISIWWKSWLEESDRPGVRQAGAWVRNQRPHLFPLVSSGSPTRQSWTSRPYDSSLWCHDWPSPVLLPKARKTSFESTRGQPGWWVVRWTCWTLLIQIDIFAISNCFDPHNPRCGQWGQMRFSFFSTEWIVRSKQINVPIKETKEGAGLI